MLASLFKTQRSRSYSVNLQDGSQFSVAPAETLLEGALKSGLPAPHNCRVGACTTCRCRVLDGRAKSLIDRAYVLQPQDINAGVFLACQTLAVSDLKLDWSMDCVAEPRHSGTVTGLRQLTPRVWRVRMSTTGVLNARPGQFLSITTKPEPGQNLVRQFSIVAIAVELGNTIFDIDIARRNDGQVSNWLTREDAIGSSVQLEGPFGNCVAHEAGGPLIAVGAGSGIGAAMGVVMHSHAVSADKPTALLAYGENSHDIYGYEETVRSASQAGVQHLFRAWANETSVSIPNIFSGRAPMGLSTVVTEVATLADRKGDGRHCQILLYGPPGFVDCSIEELGQYGVPAEHIRYDRFEPTVARQGQTLVN